VPETDAAGEHAALLRAREVATLAALFAVLALAVAFAAPHGDPRFEALVREIATSWVARFEAKTDPTQIEVCALATPHLARGDRDVAIRVLERALAPGGPIDARLRDEIDQLRALPR
jgi:hypothetical protein